MQGDRYECRRTPRRHPSLAARRPAHLVESLASDPAGVALGTTLARIERGLPQATCAELDWRLFRAKMVVFVGYSGSDFFEVDPYLKQRLTEDGSMLGKTVVWLAHSHAPVAVASGAEAAAAQRLLEWFNRAGASVYHLRGPTRELVLLASEPLLRLGGAETSPKREMIEARRRPRLG